jgi:carbonic anhydrase
MCVPGAFPPPVTLALDGHHTGVMPARRRWPARLAAANLVALAALSTAACGGGPDQPDAARRPAPRTSTRPSVAPANGDPEWHYEGPARPERWGTLSPRFAACGAGRAQSPIDLAAPAMTAAADALGLRLPSAALRIAHHEHVADGINNGHTIQVNVDDGDTLYLGDSAYALVQYHFHHPSEHTLDGRRFPMEMHLVHRSATGDLAVVGVLVAEGAADHPAFAPIWANLPVAKGVETHYAHVQVDVDAMLPAARTSYRYDGSLTTPPCTEGVRWVVLNVPIELSAAQIHAFVELIGDNSRPLQPLNGRTVATDLVQTLER